MSQHDQIMAALEGILKRLDGIDDRLADGDEKITDGRIATARLEERSGMRDKILGAIGGAALIVVCGVVVWAVTGTA